MCDDCGWEELLDEIDDMLWPGNEFEWAADTLVGIQEWVQKAEHCTERQKTAIGNIHSRGR